MRRAVLISLSAFTVSFAGFAYLASVYDNGIPEREDCPYTPLLDYSIGGIVALIAAAIAFAVGVNSNWIVGVGTWISIIGLLEWASDTNLCPVTGAGLILFGAIPTGLAIVIGIATYWMLDSDA